MKTMYKVKKHFKFECSHRLYGLEDSPCKCLHGHSYNVWVELSSESLDKYGMVVDFSKLKSFQEWLDSYFDHATILVENDPLISILRDEEKQKIYIMNTTTTAEHMANLFAQKIKMIPDLIPIWKYIKKISISVAETVNNIAIYEEKY